MRPVNLIPANERRGSAPTRTGPVAYLIVGALVAVLGGVALLVTTSNTIAEREAEVSRLEAEKASATARAESMSAFAEFAAVQEARTATVSSLAQSRFDWERILRELALVIPGDVWLIDLTGTVGPDISVEAGGSSGSSTDSARGQVAGPALQLVGCAAGHESVARFVAALRDIDGVTRVGLSTSELPDTEQAETGTEGAGGEDCRVREFISKFEITVAFDEVSTPAADASSATPTPAAPATESSAAETAPPAASAVEEAGADVEQATNVVPGG